MVTLASNSLASCTFQLPIDSFALVCRQFLSSMIYHAQIHTLRGQTADPNIIRPLFNIRSPAAEPLAVDQSHV